MNILSPQLGWKIQKLTICNKILSAPRLRICYGIIKKISNELYFYLSVNLSTIHMFHGILCFFRSTILNISKSYKDDNKIENLTLMLRKIRANRNFSFSNWHSFVKSWLTYSVKNKFQNNSSTIVASYQKKQLFIKEYFMWFIRPLPPAPDFSYLCLTMVLLCRSRTQYPWSFQKWKISRPGDPTIFNYS